MTAALQAGRKAPSIFQRAIGYGRTEKVQAPTSKPQRNSVSTKSQNPNPKKIPSSKLQSTRPQRLGFEFWDFIEVWNLGFGIWPLSSLELVSWFLELSLPLNLFSLSAFH